MRETDTLLSHLVQRFSAHPEDLATEALAFLFQGSREATAVMADLFNQLSLPTPDSLSCRTQVVIEDGSRPDLIGVDSQGAVRLVIEAKFWAGLTDNQPTAYLNHLPAGTGLLLFVAPADRMELLWPVLLQRCRARGLDVTVRRAAEPYFATMASHPGIGLISWRSLLGQLHVRVASRGDNASLANVDQLVGLCEAMDTVAFRPVRSEELWACTPRRLLQYLQLIDRVVDRLLGSGVADKERLRSGVSKGIYGQYMWLGDVGVQLKVDVSRWAESECYPISMVVCGGRDEQWTAATGRSYLPVLEEFRQAGRLFDQVGYPPEIGLLIPLDVEEDAVIASLAGQLSEIRAILGDGQRFP